MINLTPIARRIFASRVKACESWYGNTERVQRRQLDYLLGRGRDTIFGQAAGFNTISDYEKYARKVPLTAYDHLRPLVMRMISGEADVLWPGRTRRFAQSSGTSDGKSKYVPVTDDSLRLNHYRGAGDSVSHYLHLYPESRMFAGKGFVLGGSFSNELTCVPSGVKVGDLSANLIDAINPLANFFRVPSKQVALMTDWQDKLPALVEESIGSDVTNISGVPSWFLTVLRKVLERTGRKSVHDVWPNLEVFFHGGISFAPYREQYDAILDPARMHYMETYNASEGFFAYQTDRTDKSMQLLLDGGCFYEFISPDDTSSQFPDALPAWAVKLGETYAMVITSCNGLWRYPLGDTVTIVSTDPLKIVIAGRTRHYINAFGEELMVHNADAAIAKACHKTGAAVANYTAAPVYTTDKNHGRHQWIIEFSQMPAKGTEDFAEVLDKCLQDENSDYQAKRAHSIFLDRLTISVAPEGLFDRWLASTGKLGGQRKVPRLCNDRRYVDPLLSMINKEK